MNDDMEQLVVDLLCNTQHDRAVEQVAREFNTTTDRIRTMLSDEDGLYENEPEYDRYFEVLSEYVEQAKHS